ncbi:MAG: Hsp20/alpha crystallin family protein [Candidatus Helarchaeota archaeon]
MSLILRPHSLFDIDRFFDDLFIEPFEITTRFEMPKMDIKELDDHYEIKLEVPGFDKSDINIEIKNDILTIKSEKETKKEEKDEEGCYIYKEISRQNFSRSLTLPENVDKENIKANMENGILKIILNKTEIEPPKKIEIETLDEKKEMQEKNTDEKE